MALLEVRCFSTALKMCVHFNIVLPQRQSTGEIGISSRGAQKYPVLYLLHGLSDDDTIWLRRTSIERYATEQGIAVVMPTTHRAWYIDTPAGAYFTFVGTELPQLVAEFCPTISADRADTYIAGLSMGGYGAMHIALAHPDRYAAAASLSGALDIAAPARTAQMMSEGVLAGDPTGTENDVYAQARALADTPQKPDLFFWCGTEDSLLADSRKMRDLTESLGFRVTYSESAGVHAWAYWDAQIQNVLAWIADLRKEAR